MWLPSERFQFAALAALVLAAYLTALPGGFVWLDHTEILEGGYRAESLSDLGLLATSTLEHYQDRGRDATVRSGGYWRPMVAVSNSIDWMLYQRQAWLYHLENIAWHAAVVCGLLALARRLLPDNPQREATAFWSAALFAVHPLNVHSVAWISGRKDMLAAAFSIGSLLAVTMALQARGAVRHSTAGAPMPRGIQLGPRAWIALAMVSFAAALASKESAAVVPLLATWIGLTSVQSATGRAGGPARSAAWAIAGLWLLVLAWAALRHFALGGLTLNARWPSDSFSENVATFAQLGWHYVGRVAWPIGPSISDSWLLAHPLHWRSVAAMLGLAAVAALLATVVRMRWRGPLAWGLAWYVAWMLPVSGLVPLRHLRAERYLYPASWGLLLIFVGVLVHYWPPERAALLRRSLLPLLVAVLAAVTVWENTWWWSDARLFKHATEQDSGYIEGHIALGTHHLTHGQYRQAATSLEQAMRAAKQPRHVGYYPAFIAHTNLGLAYYHLGEHDRALAMFLQAAELRPRHAAAPYHLGLVAMARGDYPQAAGYFEQSLALAPGDYLATSNLARCVLLLGDAARAATLLEPLLRQRPDDALNLGNYAAALLLQEKFEQATLPLRRLIVLEPEAAVHHAKLAWCLWMTGQQEAARQSLAKAQQLDAHDATVLDVSRLMTSGGANQP